MFATAEKSTASPGIIHRHGNDNPVFFRKPGEEETVGEQQSTFFSPAVQAKLSVSRPDDPQEKEADAVASQVMRMPEPVSEPEKNHHTTVIQRTGRGPPGNMMNFEQNLHSSRGYGTPLPGTTRDFMQNRFNADFSGVRIHTGSHAESMSNTIHAQAFTHGQDIYFNSGKYSPHTEAGGTLLAHELTHTIQQGAGNVRLQRKLLDESIVSNIDLSARAGGHQLPKEAKDYLEDYYNKDLSDIRIFSDNEIAGICRAAGIKAFTKDKNIAIPPSRFEPESEDGAVLLSEQVSTSLKQRGIRSTATDGNDIGGANTLIGQIMAAIKTVKEEAEKIPKEKSAEPPAAIPEGESKDKIAAVEKSPAGQKDKAKGPGKGKGKAKDTGGRSFKAVKRDPQKSPSTPEEDPAFLAVVNNSKKRAKDQKQHEDAGKKSLEALNSAESVPNEAESKAQNRKTEGMGEAAKVDKPFNAASFKADLLKKIEEVTPKSLEEANEFKENNKIGGVKNAMGEKLASEKENTTGPVSASSKQPLQVNPGDNKQPVPLPPTPQGPMPPGINAKNAAPKNKTESEISMQEQSQSLDDEMKQNNVTESQLTTSNEPTFSQALDEKRNAQKDAAEKPQEYRKDEALTLKEAKAEANSTSFKSLAGMHNARGKNFEVAVTHQQTAKQKDEEARAKVAIDIEKIYTAAETKVNKALSEADSESNRIFDEGAEAARVQFENYVERKMNEYKIKRYSGFWGGLRWAKDKLFGMPDAVNQFYTDGRAQYLKQMDDVITLVADTVTIKLNEAKQAITDGKKEIDKYVAKLPKDLQEVGKEAADNIKDKFDTLEQSVNDKRDQLIEGLAKKYVDNVKKLDERINELKEANKGLIDKAIGFLKKVWKVIKDLVNLFTTILARLASIIGVILDSPSGFFANLGKAFKMGFDNFKNKFTEYLELGLMEWLATNLGIKGIELPKKFDASAIFSLALQVMGITKEHIKARAVALIGERKVAMLEKAGGLIYRVYNEGLGVIWEMIVEKLSDFKELVWDAIKSFIQKSIIEAALMFILSLLNPIGAFIKLCVAIYDFLMMLVKFKDRIIELLDTILSAVMQIASGAVEGAAAMIEKALAKSISIIIAFLAALLHLNNIFSKIREIITRIQKRVEKALDWVILKAYTLVGKVVEGALKLEDKATEMVEKGTQAVVGAGKKVAGKVMGWLGLKKEFTSEGESHKIFIKGNESAAFIMIASDEMTFPTLISNKQKEINELKTPSTKSKKQSALDKANKIYIDHIIKIKDVLLIEENEDKKKTLQNDLNSKFNEIVPHLIILGVGSGRKLPPTKVMIGSSGGIASFSEADPLTYINSKKPERVTVEPNGWASHIKTIPKYSDIYVRLHLLHFDLGGPGNDTGNVTPGRKTENTSMYNQAESNAISIVHSDKKMLWYRAEVTGYRSEPGFTDFAEGIKVKYGFKELNDSGEWARVGDVLYDNVFSISKPEQMGAGDPIPTINTVAFNYWDTELKNITGAPSRKVFRDWVTARTARGGYNSWTEFVGSPEFIKANVSQGGTLANWFNRAIALNKLRNI